MSFTVSCSGLPREVEATLERAGEVGKAGRNAFEQKAIDLGVAAGVAAMKHVSIDDSKRASVSISGHYNDDGTGGFGTSVSISGS